MPPLNHTVTIRSILHPTDFSQTSELAFAHALRLALYHEAQLSILHVEKDRQDVHWDEYPSVRRTLERWGLIEPHTRRSEVRAQLGISIEKIVTEGRDVLNSIVHFTDKVPLDLIVLATHPQDGLPRWLHRSIAEPVARHSHLATLFVPDGSQGFVRLDTGEAALDHVLVPAHRTPHPQRAVDRAVSLLEAFGTSNSRLTVLHVGDAGELPAISYPPEMTWELTVRNESGPVVERILQTAAELRPQVMVMVTEGHHGLMDSLRGSTTEQVVRDAECPVLAIPAREQVEEP